MFCEAGMGFLQWRGEDGILKTGICRVCILIPLIKPNYLYFFYVLGSLCPSLFQDQQNQRMKPDYSSTSTHLEEV
ncbi:hypothetical protein DBR11_28920 [Pedobacter sp. HMWF019]|nr:hypothetical protein DBR11_28920 [Pedobacter sp. HMWF019]